MKKADNITLRDVAEQAGVSIDTVSRVLNGKGKETWPSAMRRANEIRQIAERMSYRPNAAARAIRSSRTRVIGALVRNNPRDRHIHPLAFETLLGVNEGLEAAGYVMSVIRFNDVQFESPAGSRVFREHMLDGMVVVGGMPQEATKRMEELVPACVWANTNVWRPHFCIRRDEVQVGRLTAQKMIELGYRRLVLVGGAAGSVPHYSHAERFEGLSSVAEANGLKVDRVRVPWTKVFNPSEFPIEWLNPEVAVIAEAVSWAHWVTQLAGGVGKTPGYDFGLACCEDSGETGRYWPGLSRCSFDHYEMGVEAARMILEQLEPPQAPPESQKFQSEWRAGNTAWGPNIGIPERR